jgi:hypothetical protein
MAGIVIVVEEKANSEIACRYLIMHSGIILVGKINLTIYLNKIIRVLSVL